MFIWNDEFSVGIPEVDEQHKIFIFMLNDLFAIKRDESNLESINKIITDFIAYAEWHFGAEVKYMKICNFSLQKEHLEEHKLILDRFTELKYEIKNCFSDDYMSELYIILKKWFVSHLTSTDQLLYKYIIDCNKLEIIQRKEI
jgi:hemerythrin-like metal-binding protein